MENGTTVISDFLVAHEERRAPSLGCLDLELNFFFLSFLSKLIGEDC